MNYIARISGGSSKVKHVKDVIIKSNPLLESFGNSATLRNWNSSRFGKYVEIVFGPGGEPIGGRISNFLLEKSRIVSLGKGERNFHIFYQLLSGADQNTKETLGISNIDYYSYLNKSSCHKAEGTDDAKEYAETLQAMQVIGISDETKLEILKLVSAVLHIGNIPFVEQGNYASVEDDDFLQYPAYLLGLNAANIKEKLISRRMESKWGRQTEEIDITHNVEQAIYTRDALAKALYTRMFDFLVESVNKALDIPGSTNRNLSVGILDIYGFEIFEYNGFEQFCINFINEKLQQIFVELTLKSEQDEYVAEGIEWTPIDYFNNKIVCDLIESKRPPGIMCQLDDICSQIHGQSEGVDNRFLVKLKQQFEQHEHYATGAECFIIKHYAGDVTYQINGFCDKNRDVLYPDLIQLMQSSTSSFLRSLFPENVSGNNKKPTSASTKIRTQANKLVESLTACTPHYVRCIKPNENKRALEFDQDRVMHQVKYLGLKENVRVRRAGYAYRRAFDKFLWRYAILSTETWPLRNYHGDAKKGCEIICRSAGISRDQFQLGKTKIFIKNPESLFLLEEARERKYDSYARTLQKAFKKFVAKKHYMKMKEAASDLLFGRKERRRFSLNRNFVGDYIGIEHNPALQVIVGRRERIDFAAKVTKYDRSFKTTKLDMILTTKHITLVGRKLEKKGPNKGKLIEEIKRQIPLNKIRSVGLSPFQDDILVINVIDEYTSFLETPLKTEFLTALVKRYKEQTGQELELIFITNLIVILKKQRIQIGSPGTREIKFSIANNASTEVTTLKPDGKILHVFVAPGLSNNTRPRYRPASEVSRPTNGYRPQHQQQQASSIRPAQTTTNYAAPNIQVPSAQPKYVPPQFNGFNPAEVLQHKSKNSSANAVHPAPPAIAPRPAPKPKPKGPQVRALYDYDARDLDELTFQEGQLIELISEDPSGWWQGRLGTKTGLFPANYVEKV
uniref:Uncharacterized protein n=1 Tax=Panagrolaimus sp. ES5 TaxID=591445 RepID=A0AC34EZQ8_9BILA